MMHRNGENESSAPPIIPKMQTRRRTRSIQQQNERVASTPVKGERPQRLLQSPSRIDEYYAPRKTPRTVPEKSFKDVIRAVRKTGGQQSRSGHQASLQLTGLLASLPREPLEHILGHLSAKDLGVLETTCQYFIKSGITEKVAQHYLKEIPRARGLKPDFKHGESSVTLLSFVNGQSTAAAQGTAVALGTYHSVVLAKNSLNSESPEYSLSTFGRGFHGQLGNGEYSNMSKPVQVNEVERGEKTMKLYCSSKSQQQSDDIQLAVVSTGSSHSASISRRGELYTWGLASSGELGHGGWTPIEVAVPRMITSLGRTRIVSVCAGANHTLAISEAGQLWTCGRGRHGQLGHGHFHDEGLLMMVESICSERIVSAAAGRAHSVALAADGKIFTWGDARRGQLGHAQLAPLMQGPNPQPIAVPVPQAIECLDPARLKAPQRVTAIAAGGDQTMAVTVGGALLACGANAHGQLGTGDNLDRIVPTEIDIALENMNEYPVRAMQVQCGTSHTVALCQVKGSPIVYTTGDNSYGQLGLGDRIERSTFHRVKNLEGKQITCVVAGDWHNAAVSQDGDLYMWGRGDCGQLGFDDDRNRWEPKLLDGYTVVHPDRTLRRNRRQPKKQLILQSASKPKHPRNGRRRARS